MSAVKKRSTKPVAASTSATAAKLPEPLAQCLALLKVIQSKGDAAAFLYPVDWETYGLHDYPQIIKTPMDLGTVQSRLESGKYGHPDQFAKDVRLVWKNAMDYNRPDSDIHAKADKLRRLFERRFAKIKKGGKRKRDGTEVQVTRVDQTRFAQLAASLQSEDLGVVIDMIQKECPEALNEEDEEDVEIEIANLDAQTLRSLIDFAESRVANTIKAKVK